MFIVVVCLRTGLRQQHYCYQQEVGK